MPNNSYVVAKSLIDLEDYSADEVSNYVEAYYPSLEDLKNEYGDSANGIIIECIFESLQPVDYAYQFPAKLEIEAMSIIHGIITK